MAKKKKRKRKKKRKKEKAARKLGDAGRGIQIRQGP